MSEIMEKNTLGVSVGTTVLTSKGRFQIQDVKIGDSVLNHKNSFKRVSRLTKESYDGELYRVRAAGLEPVVVTSGQPLYVKKNVFDAPEWIASKDVQTGWYIGIPDKINSEEIVPSAYVNEVIWAKVKYCSPIENERSVYMITLFLNDDSAYTVNGYAVAGGSKE